MKNEDHPSSHFNDGKMARFALRANSSFIFGGGGISFFTLSKIVAAIPISRGPTT